jgi:hypothetical protein
MVELEMPLWQVILFVVVAITVLAVGIFTDLKKPHSYPNKPISCCEMMKGSQEQEHAMAYCR